MMGLIQHFLIFTVINLGSKKNNPKKSLITHLFSILNHSNWMEPHECVWCHKRSEELHSIYVRTDCQTHICIECEKDPKVATNYLRYYINFGSNTEDIPVNFWPHFEGKENQGCMIYRGLHFDTLDKLCQFTGGSLELGSTITPEHKRCNSWSKDEKIACARSRYQKHGIVISYHLKSKDPLMLVDTTVFFAENHPRPNEQLVILKPGTIHAQIHAITTNDLHS